MFVKAYEAHQEPSWPPADYVYDGWPLRMLTNASLFFRKFQI